MSSHPTPGGKGSMRQTIIDFVIAIAAIAGAAWLAGEMDGAPSGEWLMITAGFVGWMVLIGVVAGACWLAWRALRLVWRGGGYIIRVVVRRIGA